MPKEHCWEREHRNSHPRKHLENTFLWLIGGLLFHQFISFPCSHPLKGICFPSSVVLFFREDWESFGEERIFFLAGQGREDFYSVTWGKRILEKKELWEACYEIELFIKYVNWVCYTHIMCYRNIEQSFHTQLCIDIETRPLIKMKAPKHSDVTLTPCYANRSALLNWIYNHLIRNLCNLCWTSSILNALQMIPTEHSVAFSDKT